MNFTSCIHDERYLFLHVQFIGMSVGKRSPACAAPREQGRGREGRQWLARVGEVFAVALYHLHVGRGAHISVRGWHASTTLLLLLSYYVLQKQSMVWKNVT